MPNLYNINVAALDVLPTPEEIKRQLPMTATAEATVLAARQTVQNILDHRDHRVFVVVGPCSIHDVMAAREYARRLRALADEVGDTLFPIMRVYFEKPRTTVGWKGLINDPHLDDSFDIAEGLRIARALLLEIAELGLPTGTEALDPLCPQYLDDLLTWTAIGARTTESQTHREMASGLSTPVGFKNGTNGSLEVAINALQSASRPHSFLGINSQGQSAVVRTTGNRYGHVVLRGGSEGPELRHGDHSPVRAGTDQKPVAAQHRGRLQPRQRPQGPGLATPGHERLRASDSGRQPFHRGLHDREQPGLGQPVHSRRPLATEIWRFDHRPLRRLGDD